MKSLLIVELNSTKVRFLKVNNCDTPSPTIARKSFKSNKNITKSINYSEIQKMNEYVNNALNNRFKSFAYKKIYISDTVPTIYLSRIKAYFNGKDENLFADMLSLKKKSFLIKNDFKDNELSFLLYNDRFYIAYMLRNRLILQSFLHDKEVKDFVDLKTAFLTRLLMFDIPTSINKISIIIDEDFYFKSFSFEFLKKYFRKVEIEYKILNFIGFLEKNTPKA